MIAEVRDYIRKCIKEIDKSYLENSNPFPDIGETLATNKIDKSFQIIMGASEVELSDQDEAVSNLSVTLRTFKQGTRDKLADFDEGYCDALLIKSRILDKSKINTLNYTKGITSPSVNPTEIDGSQDVYAFETTLTFKLSYGIGA